ncbi:MAG: hypothetical protein LUH22_11460 [Bacteroides sp.]|nr:hypothetical protein [Bacteroides sp.]
MKTWILGLTFLLNISYLYATGASGDIAYLNGEKWYMLDKPIERSETLREAFHQFLPEERSISTADWEGYTAFWEIKNNQLLLQKVEVEIGDSIQVIQNLNQVFANYQTPTGILASWVNADIRLGRGETVRYVHMGFDRNEEEECILTVQEGIVLHQTFYQNKKVKGYTMEEIHKEIIQRFPWQEFPELSKKRIIYMLQDIQVNEKGAFASASISARIGVEWINDNDHPLIVALRKILESIYPWEYLIIHGERRVEHPSFFLSFNVSQSR